MRGVGNPEGVARSREAGRWWILIQGATGIGMLVQRQVMPG